MKHWTAAVLKQKYARMHQILFPFPPDLRHWGLCPHTPGEGGRGCEGREGKGRGREGDGEVYVIAVDVIDAPGVR